MPDQLTVRVVQVSLHRPGYRTHSVTLVTTLLDAQAYPALELARLYLRRWCIELWFRHIKTTMGMEYLRCLSPAMVHHEDLARIGFKGAVDRTRQFNIESALFGDLGARKRLDRTSFFCLSAAMKPRSSQCGWRLGLSFCVAAGSFSLAAATDELLPPFRVEANGKPIDMEVGNAAPFVTDFDGDGVFDLMLGQRGECKLRIYRNLGSNKSPRFGVSAFFKAGGVDASLPGG